MVRGKGEHVTTSQRDQAAGGAAAEAATATAMALGNGSSNSGIGISSGGSAGAVAAATTVKTSLSGGAAPNLLYGEVCLARKVDLVSFTWADRATLVP